MGRKLVLGMIVVAAFGISFLAKRAIQKNEEAGAPGAVALPAGGDEARVFPMRIISLAPSITETLHALGLMGRVVGVTRYCDYPPEALAKTRIGGYYDPNYEAIVTLDPDLIILLAEHDGPRKHLAGLGYDIVAVDHKSISGILRSIEAVGAACGASEKAKSVTDGIRVRMARIREKASGQPSPRVMVSIGRNMGSGALNDVYISGKEGFYDEMIEMIGGVNAYGGGVAFPVVSSEGIITMNPEVIIDMVPDLEENGWTQDMIRGEWKALYQVDAVKRNRVYVFGEDYVAVPGPRFISIMEKMARAMYPGIDWD
ncbi:MAG: ABC transporter substrate-binding protein [Acidobacteria bacterium]|nr:ABC transporter substrate-binding protein [Acidobacteriota bacterium]